MDFLAFIILGYIWFYPEGLGEIYAKAEYRYRVTRAKLGK